MTPRQGDPNFWSLCTTLEEEELSWATLNTLRHIIIKKSHNGFFFFFERGRERKREKQQCVVASHTPPTGDLTCNLGICLRLGSELATLWLTGWHSTTEPDQPALPMTFFTEIEQAILKFMQNHKRPWIAKAIEKEEQSWRHAPWLQTMLQSYTNQNSMVLEKPNQKIRYIDQWNRIESWK